MESSQQEFRARAEFILETLIYRVFL